LQACARPSLAPRGEKPKVPELRIYLAYDLAAVVQEQDGAFVADCSNEDIIMQADSWDELRRNVREAVSAFFFDSTPPVKIRLQVVR
jgi:hypothetical protein